jgi:hypothetical protein
MFPKSRVENSSSAPAFQLPDLRLQVFEPLYNAWSVAACCRGVEKCTEVHPLKMVKCPAIYVKLQM